MGKGPCSTSSSCSAPAALCCCAADDDMTPRCRPLSLSPNRRRVPRKWVGEGGNAEAVWAPFIGRYPDN
jgi:hypothetical protein